MSLRKNQLKINIYNPPWNTFDLLSNEFSENTKAWSERKATSTDTIFGCMQNKKTSTSQVIIDWKVQFMYRRCLNVHLTKYKVLGHSLHAIFRIFFLVWCTVRKSFTLMGKHRVWMDFPTIFLLFCYMFVQ